MFFFFFFFFFFILLAEKEDTPVAVLGSFGSPVASELLRQVVLARVPVIALRGHY